jgi:hypothetical protein
MSKMNQDKGGGLKEAAGKVGPKGLKRAKSSNAVEPSGQLGPV